MPRTPYNNRDSSIEVAGAIGGGASKLKKKIRDIERLLKKDKLPATVRTDNERALKALNVDLQNTQLNLRSQKIAKKYHMVRFFEKKKAVRKLKQALKQLEEATATDVRKDIKKVRKVVRHAEIDLVYVILFPKDEKYISLFPNEQEEPVDDLAKKGLLQTDDRRRAFRKECEELLEQDKLPFSLADAASGKTVYINEEYYYNYNNVNRKEIDAPEVKKDDEDDFFE